MGTPELAIACVLKVGRWQHADYRPEIVQWLQRQALLNVSVPVRFVCLSDVEIDGVETIPLTDDLPGWWSKLELFKHDLGRVLYLDLDTLIVGSLDEMLLHPHRFTASAQLSDNQGGCINSSVMAWAGPRLDLYETFMERPEHWIATCNTAGNWGDQGFIHHHVGHKDTWQALFPGRVLSFKEHLKRTQPPPHGASVICFHGEPKPWDANVPRWVKQHYADAGI